MWYKGNIHTHTNRSDGDSDPQAVARWYRRNGYDFLVVTDHNHLTLLDWWSRRRRYLPMMIPGEEVSVSINNGVTAIHVNGIGIKNVIEPIDAGDVVSTLQANIDSVRRAGGIASINHPNYTWAFDHRHILQVHGASLLEIYNANNITNVNGGEGHPSYEEIWDGVLSGGRPIFGVAVDDSHHFKGDFKPSMANPGRGWVVVQAPALESEAIVEALESGGFYSSTGVFLEELEARPEGIRLRIKQEWDFLYQTEFIGRGGEVFHRAWGAEASYHVAGSEGYIRAQVRASDGSKAWVQPVFCQPKVD